MDKQKQMEKYLVYMKELIQLISYAILLYIVYLFALGGSVIFQLVGLLAFIAAQSFTTAIDFHLVELKLSRLEKKRA